MSDEALAKSGTSKARILTAMVYITDRAEKEEMNRVWDEWADRANPPMRACVAALTGESRVLRCYERALRCYEEDAVSSKRPITVFIVATN